MTRFGFDRPSGTINTKAGKRSKSLLIFPNFPNFSFHRNQCARGSALATVLAFPAPAPFEGRTLYSAPIPASISTRSAAATVTAMPHRYGALRLQSAGGGSPGMVTGHRRQHLGLTHSLPSSVGPTSFRGRQFPFLLLSYMETDHWERRRISCR